DSCSLATLHSAKESLVRVWNVQTGKEILSFPGSKADAPHLLFFTPDGKTLLIAGKRVVGYEVASGKEVFSWRMQPLPAGPVRKNQIGGVADENDRIAWRTLTVSPDGSTAACILAGGGFGEEPLKNRIVLCDARTGKVRMRCGDSGVASPWGEQLC